MSTIEADIQARQGDTLHAVLLIDGGASPDVPYPAADYDVALEAGWYDGGEIILDGDTGGIVLSPDGGGTVVIDLSAAATLALPAGRVARYQVTTTAKVGGAVLTLFDGYFNVAERVVPR